MTDDTSDLQQVLGSVESGWEHSGSSLSLSVCKGGRGTLIGNLSEGRVTFGSMGGGLTISSQRRSSRFSNICSKCAVLSSLMIILSSSVLGRIPCMPGEPQ